MYLIPTNQPIVTYGDDVYLKPSVAQSLRHLRTALDGRFGKITVLAPSVCRSSVDECCRERLQCFDSDREGIEIASAFTQASYMVVPESRKQKYWKEAIRNRLHDSSAIEVQLQNPGDLGLVRGVLQAIDGAIPTVFSHFQNDDCVQRASGSTWPKPSRLQAQFIRHRIRRDCSALVKRADLSLFNRKELLQTIGKYSKNPRFFASPTISERDVISETQLVDRLENYHRDQAFRLVCVGSFDPVNQFNLAVAIVRAARDLGANMSLDIYGQGSLRSELQYQIAKLELTRHVRLHAPLPEDASAIAELSQYDAAFSVSSHGKTTEPMEVYAAGLPILTFGLKGMSNLRVGFPLGTDSIAEAAGRLAELDMHRGMLVEFSFDARSLAIEESMESWYARRADWMLDAIPRAHSKWVEPNRASENTRDESIAMTVSRA